MPSRSRVYQEGDVLSKAHLLWLVDSNSLLPGLALLDYSLLHVYSDNRHLQPVNSGPPTNKVSPVEGRVVMSSSASTPARHSRAGLKALRNSRTSRSSVGGESVEGDAVGPPGLKSLRSSWTGTDGVESVKKEEDALGDVFEETVFNDVDGIPTTVARLEPNGNYCQADCFSAPMKNCERPEIKTLTKRSDFSTNGRLSDNVSVSALGNGVTTSQSPTNVYHSLNFHRPPPVRLCDVNGNDITIGVTNRKPTRRKSAVARLELNNDSYEENENVKTSSTNRLSIFGKSNHKSLTSIPTADTNHYQTRFVSETTANEQNKPMLSMTNDQSDKTHPRTPNNTLSNVEGKYFTQADCSRKMERKRLPVNFAERNGQTLEVRSQGQGYKFRPEIERLRSLSRRFLFRRNSANIDLKRYCRTAQNKKGRRKSEPNPNFEQVAQITSIALPEDPERTPSSPLSSRGGKESTVEETTAADRKTETKSSLLNRHRNLRQTLTLTSRPVLGEVSIKVILLGDYGIGKSLLLDAVSKATAPGKTSFNCTAFRPGEFVELTLVRGDGSRTRIKVMDTAGQERFRSITSSYFRGAQGCFLVFNTERKDSFDNIMQWYSDMHTYTDPICTLLLGVNTASNPRRAEREVTPESAFRLADSLRTQFLETTLDDEEMLVWSLQKMVDKVTRKLIPDPGQLHYVTISPSLSSNTEVLSTKFVCCT